MKITLMEIGNILLPGENILSLHQGENMTKAQTDATLIHMSVRRRRGTAQ